VSTFSQLRILTDDFAASFRFYRDVLGLPPQDGASESGPYGCFKLGDGSSDIALFVRAYMAAALEGPAAEAVAAGGAGVVVVLRVDEVDAFYHKAIAAGAVSAGAPADKPDWGLRAAYLQAPEGTVIELCSY